MAADGRNHIVTFRSGKADSRAIDIETANRLSGGKFERTRARHGKGIGIQGRKLLARAQLRRDPLSHADLVKVLEGDIADVRVGLLRSVRSKALAGESQRAAIDNLGVIRSGIVAAAHNRTLSERHLRAHVHRGAQGAHCDAAALVACGVDLGDRAIEQVDCDVSMFDEVGASSTDTPVAAAAVKQATHGGAVHIDRDVTQRHLPHSVPRCFSTDQGTARHIGARGNRTAQEVQGDTPRVVAGIGIADPSVDKEATHQGAIQLRAALHRHRDGAADGTGARGAVPAFHIGATNDVRRVLASIEQDIRATTDGRLNQMAMAILFRKIPGRKEGATDNPAAVGDGIGRVDVNVRAALERTPGNIIGLQHIGTDEHLAEGRRVRPLGKIHQDFGAAFKAQPGVCGNIRCLPVAADDGTRNIGAVKRGLTRRHGGVDEDVGAAVESTRGIVRGSVAADDAADRGAIIDGNVGVTRELGAMAVLIVATDNDVSRTALHLDVTVANEVGPVPAIVPPGGVIAARDDAVGAALHFNPRRTADRSDIGGLGNAAEHVHLGRAFGRKGNATRGSLRIREIIRTITRTQVQGCLGGCSLQGRAGREGGKHLAAPAEVPTERRLPVLIRNQVERAGFAVTFQGVPPCTLAQHGVGRQVGIFCNGNAQVDPLGCAGVGGRSQRREHIEAEGIGIRLRTQVDGVASIIGERVVDKRHVVRYAQRAVQRQITLVIHGQGAAREQHLAGSNS